MARSCCDMSGLSKISIWRSACGWRLCGGVGGPEACWPSTRGRDQALTAATSLLWFRCLLNRSFSSIGNITRSRSPLYIICRQVHRLGSAKEAMWTTVHQSKLISTLTTGIIISSPKVHKCKASIICPARPNAPWLEDLQRDVLLWSAWRVGITCSRFSLILITRKYIYTLQFRDTQTIVMMASLSATPSSLEVKGWAEQWTPPAAHVGGNVAYLSQSTPTQLSEAPEFRDGEAGYMRSRLHSRRRKTWGGARKLRDMLCTTYRQFRESGWGVEGGIWRQAE